MSKKPGVMIYFDMLPRFEKLTYEQCGHMMIAILKYAQDGIEPEFDDVVLSVYWDFIKEKIDKDDEAYQKKSKMAKQAAEARWKNVNAGECERMQTDADACDGMQPDASGCDLMRLMPTTTTSTSTPTDTTTTTTTSTTKGTKSNFSPDEGLGKTIDYFLNRINNTPPQYVLEKIKYYYEQMGADCCIRAFDIALAEKQTRWSYINTTLRNKLSQGVRCLADWDETDKKWRDKHDNSRTDGKDTAEPEYKLNCILLE